MARHESNAATELDWIEKAWRNSLPPFHDRTLHLECPWTFPAFSTASGLILAQLRKSSGAAAFTSYIDWHEHDGLRFQSEPFDLARIGRALANPEQLGALCPGDDKVRLAIHPASKACLWRIGLEFCEWHGTRWEFFERWDGKQRVPVSEPHWYFSLSGSEQLIETVLFELTTTPAMQPFAELRAQSLVAERSGPYFKTIYAG